MKKKLWLRIIIITLILLLLYFYLHHKPIPEDQGVAVTAAPVKQQDVTVLAEAVGTVQAYATVKITSQVQGRILSVGFKEGEYVHVNQPLFFLDPHQYEIDLQKSEANLAHDQATYETAQYLVQHNLPLVKKGYTDKQDFNQMTNNAASLLAAVKADQADVAKTQLKLSYCTIASPIEGLTGSIMVQPGNIIDENDSKNPLVIINQISPIYVKFTLQEELLPAIRKGMAAGSIYIHLKDDGSSQSKLGKIIFIDNTVTDSTGTFQLKAIFPNQDQHLWPGQFVQLSVPIEHRKNALLVPTQAIQISPTNSYVYIIDKNNHVKQVNISTGPTIGENTIIENGLQPNMLIVTTGQLLLTDGMLVQVINGRNS